MKKRYVLFLVLIIQTVNCGAETVIPDDVKEFFEEYRKAVSKAVAETSNMRFYKTFFSYKYYHYMSDFRPFDKMDKTFFIITDDYSVESVTVTLNSDMKYSNEYNKLLKNAKEDNYYIHIIDNIVGEIKDNKLSYYAKPKTHRCSIDINKTSDGLKVLRDLMYTRYYVLESDVPILMERITKGAVNYGTEEVIRGDVKEFYEEYRNLKSKLLAENGTIKPNREFIDKYFHSMPLDDTVSYDRAENIYNGNKTVPVIAGDYFVENVSMQPDVYTEYRDRMGNLLKTEKEDEYEIRICYTKIGEIKDNKLIYYWEPYGITTIIIINRTSDGLKVRSDLSNNIYKILESDVPIFMDRINKQMR
jgi:hypothetical protein